MSKTNTASWQLRDEFAAAALAGGLEQGVRDNMDCGWWRHPRDVAKRAYAIADAMMAERRNDRKATT